MISEFRIENAKIVMSRDEFGYQEVIDDFKNANFIYIVTFNISKNNEFLLEKLKDISPSTEVKIFTNIPSRYDTYYNEYNANIAEKQIENYLVKLDPENFSENFSSYFNFNNHIKIVTTNNMAYVGSENFSSESAKNFEAGVIVEDHESIKRIKEMIEAHIQPSSDSYYKFDILPILLSAKEVEELRTVLSENVWGMWEVRGIETGKYYKEGNINLERSFIDDFAMLLQDVVYNFKELLIKLEDYETEAESVRDELIDNISELIDKIESYEIEQDVIEFLEFDELKYIDDEINENSIFLTEDVLDEHVESYTTAAFDQNSEYASKAEDGFISLEIFLSKLRSDILLISEKLRLIINNNINNT